MKLLIIFFQDWILRESFLVISLTVLIWELGVWQWFWDPSLDSIVNIEKDKNIKWEKLDDSKDKRNKEASI